MIIASVTGVNATLLTPQHAININLLVNSTGDGGNVTDVADHLTVVTNLKYPYAFVGCYGILNAIIFTILLRLYPRTPAHPSRLITFSKSIIESETQSAYGQRATLYSDGRPGKTWSKKESVKGKTIDSTITPACTTNNVLDEMEREEKHLDDLPFDIVTATNPRTGSVSLNKSFRDRHDSTISLRSNHNYQAQGQVFSRQSSTVSTPVIGERQDSLTGVQGKVLARTPSNSANLLKKVVTLQALHSAEKSEMQMPRHENNQKAQGQVQLPQMVNSGVLSNQKDKKFNKLLREKLKDPWKVAIVALSILFMHIYYGLEITFGSFLTTYTAKSNLKLDTKVGAQLTSLFWATFTFWRLITIFYINFTGSELAIFLSLGVMLFGNCILVPFGNQHVWALWLGTATIGIGISPIWASMFGFLEDYFPVTSQIASSMITAAMVGEFFFPVIIAKYVDCNPMVFSWVCLGCSLSLPVLFVTIVILCRFKLQKAPTSLPPPQGEVAD